MRKILITLVGAFLLSAQLDACCQGNGEEIAQKIVLSPILPVVSDLCDQELQSIAENIPVYDREDFLHYYNTRMLYFETAKLPKIQRTAKEMETRFPDLFPMDEVSVKRRAAHSLNMERYIRKLYHNEFISDWFKRHT